MCAWIGEESARPQQEFAGAGAEPWNASTCGESGRSTWMRRAGLACAASRRRLKPKEFELLALSGAPPRHRAVRGELILERGTRGWEFGGGSTDGGCPRPLAARRSSNADPSRARSASSPCAASATGSLGEKLIKIDTEFL